MIATQASMAEAYGKNRKGFKNSIRSGSLMKKEYGYFSNGWAGKAIKGEAIDNTDTTDSKGGVFKQMVCESIARFLEEEEYENVSTINPYNNGKYIDVSDYKGACAFFIAYNDSGKIVYMQYTNDGKLVTFDGSSYKVEEGGKFVVHRN